MTQCYVGPMPVTSYLNAFTSPHGASFELPKSARRVKFPSAVGGQAAIHASFVRIKNLCCHAIPTHVCSLIPSNGRESVPILDSNPLPISMGAMQSMNVPTVELVNTHTGDKITKASHRSSHSTGTSTDSSSNSKARNMKTPFTLSLTRRSSTLSRRPTQRVGIQLINSSTT